MELANKFNKAEAERERERESTIMLALGPSACIICDLPCQASRQSSRSVQGRQRADFAAPQQLCLARLREEEDDVEWKGKLGPLSRRKLFSSFLSFGDAK